MATNMEHPNVIPQLCNNKMCRSKERVGRPTKAQKMELQDSVNSYVTDKLHEFGSLRFFFSSVTCLRQGWGVGSTIPLKDIVASRVTFKIHILFSRTLPRSLFPEMLCFPVIELLTFLKPNQILSEEGGKREFSLSSLGVNDPVRCNFFYFILLPRKSITALQY